MDIWTHCDEELNRRVNEIMGDWNKLLEKAKALELDIRLYPESTSLVLYFNDDYPDTILVDKDCSSKHDPSEF